MTLQGPSGVFQRLFCTVEFISALTKGHLMNFKSYGPRLVLFLAAGAVALMAIAWTELRNDDVNAIIQPASEAAPMDNDDNPKINRTEPITPGAAWDDDDRPLTGKEREKIAAAVTAAVGPGTVTDMEASDDFGTAYEAEIYDRAGTEWDVDLDAKFAVVHKSRDS